MGLILIVGCVILVTVDHMPKNTGLIQVKKDDIGYWVPILLTFGSAAAMSLHSVWTKHMTSDKVGFDPINLAFSSLGLVNLILFIVAIPYWNKNGFNQQQFWIGLAGSFIASVGLAGLMKALSCGPIGPVLAVGDGYPPFLAIIVAIKNHKMITLLEFVALVLGITGITIMVIPKQFNKYCLCCFKCNNE